MAAITLAGLAKTYPNGHVAIRHLDLRIEDGEFLVLVGPSGCGKSTLLRLIAGLETPTAGRIVMGDVDVTALPPQARDLAMVFQSYALYPHMSVRDNLAYGLKVRRTDAGTVVAQAGRRRCRGARYRRPARSSSRGTVRRPAPARRAWAGRWYASRMRFCWTSRSPTSIRALRAQARAELRRLHRSSAPPLCT